MKIKKFLFVITTMFLMVQGASAWSGSGNSASDPILIANANDWNTLATNVASGTNYSGKYFKLTADITVTTIVGSYSGTKTFNGTFDGGGHTLTFNYTATAEDTAPFAYLKNATIQNLRVAGTINTGYKFAAGLCVYSSGSTNIEACQISVTINSTLSNDGTYGGLVSDHLDGTLNINNCLFDGQLLGTGTFGCGGFVGWDKTTTNITNSLFAPTAVSVQGPTFSRTKNSNTLSLTNCYYTDSSIIGNTHGYATQGSDASGMTAEALVAALNNGNKNWCVYRSSAIPIRVNLVISTKAQWDTFAANVGNYDSKYVQLGANIGTANAPITTMTTKSTSFRGIFDGNGKTMTVNFSADTGNEGAFRYLNDGTIMNLTITGTVTAGGNYASGLVARTSGGDCLIDNCVVNTNVAGSGYAGGIVAHGDNATKLTITNCIYGGEISKVSSFSGGILGWYNNNGKMDLVINNCLCKGIYTGTADFHPIGLKRASDCSFKSISCTNCYYTTNPHNPGGRNFTDGTKVCELSLGDNIIATSSSCTFDGKTYHLGTVSLSYTPSKPTLFYMIDGNEICGNSFTISKDNQAFDAGAVTITAGDTSITYHYGGTNNTILYIDVNNGNSNMVTHPWTSEANYSSITSVVIGDGVTSICGNAFKQCPNLTSVSIPYSVTSIGNYAFQSCTKLEYVYVLPTTPPTIGYDPFNDCDALTAIVVPAAAYGTYYNDDVTSWNSYQSQLKKNIANCTATVPDQTLGRFNPATNSYYKTNKISYLFGDLTAFIGEEVIDGETKLTQGTDYEFGTISYASPDTRDYGTIGNDKVGDVCEVEIVGMGNYAGSTTATFTIVDPSGKWGDDNELSWSLNEGALSITLTTPANGNKAMKAADNYGKYPWNYYCSDATSISIGEGITSIANYAFGGQNNTNTYSNVTTVTLPSTLTSIGAEAFRGCSGATITIPTSVTTLGNDPFSNVAKVICTLNDNNSDFYSKLTTATSAEITYKRTFTENVASTVCLPFDYIPQSEGTYYTFTEINKTTSPWTVTMTSTAASLTANTPYMFKPAVTGEVTFVGTASNFTYDLTGTDVDDPDVTGGKWNLIGTYATKQWDGTHNTGEIGSVYGFAAQSHDGGSYTVSPGDFVKAMAGASIAPFRAYLKYTAPVSNAPRRGVAEEALPSRMSVRLVNADGDVTAIGTIDTKTGEIRFDSEAWYTLDGRRLNGKPSVKGMYINNGKKIIVK